MSEFTDSQLGLIIAGKTSMPSKSQLVKRKLTGQISTKRLNPLYVVRVPRPSPVLRIWVNSANVNDILTFSIIFGEGNVKLMPYPKQGIIALESGCEYRVNPRIPVGFVYVSSSDAGDFDLQPGFVPPEGDLFSL